MAEVNQTARAHRLYEASIERMDTAYQCLRRDDWVAAMYLAGLSVECILQALARLDDQQPDARHDLNHWLLKCPSDLQDTLGDPETRMHWNRLIDDWRNSLRYFPSNQLLGYVRKRSPWKSLKGDDDAKMKVWVSGFVNSADQVHEKGMQQWLQKTK